MLNLKNITLALVAVVIAACGGSDETIVGNPGTPGTPGGTPDIGSLTLITSSPQLLSDNSIPVTITALVRDTNNNVVADVPIVMSTNSGSLVLPSPAATDAFGQLAATLTTAGDPRNRTITVSGTAGSVSDTVTIDVLGTTLTLTGPTSLSLGDTGTYNIVLRDAGGTGIGGEVVDVSSSNGNAISVNPLTTDSSGQASFVLTASAGGSDELTATGMGLTTIKNVAVSADEFSFTVPDAGTEILLGASQTVTVQWLVNNAPVTNGMSVSFSTTRGTVSSSTALTAGGLASISVSATNAGPAVITATNSDGTSTQRTVEFVASNPASLEIQANPFTIGPQQQSAITAIVRDAAGNLVKNQIVDFTLDDVTGGSLAVAQDVTDSQGRATTFYTASSTTSASDGVHVTATVQGTAVSDTANLTVARREVFISIGTGNTIFEPNSAQYRVEYVVQVTDAQGNGVSGVPVQLNLLSLQYRKGFRVPVVGGWTTQVEATCDDEDVNRNGVLDLPGEDFNSNGTIEAGNIASAVVQGSGGGTMTTDQNGFGIVDIYYPQEYAYYLWVRLEATATVQGTEFAEGSTFLLTGLASDFNNEDTAPPGPNSPFGIAADCADPN